MAEPPKIFDAYEYVAVVAPGALVSLGLLTTLPALKPLLGDKPSLGEFGLFLIVAFAVGHGVQAFGNLWEALLWRCFGRPTDAVLRPGAKLLTPAQLDALARCASEMEGRELVFREISRTEWRMVVMRAYSRVRAADAAQRVDAFNRTYGLLRALSVAFLLLGVWLVGSRADVRLTLLVFIFGIALTYRMFRVSVYYARALFLSFIDLPVKAAAVACASPAS